MNIPQYVVLLKIISPKIFRNEWLNDGLPAYDKYYS